MRPHNISRFKHVLPLRKATNSVSDMRGTRRLTKSNNTRYILPSIILTLGKIFIYYFVNHNISIMGMRTKNTLLKSFMRTLDRNGDHIILGQKRNGNWEETNRRELFEMINAGIRVLKDKGVEKGDRVVYKGKTRWNGSLGICRVMLEAIWVPMYHNQNQNTGYIVMTVLPKYDYRHRRRHKQ